MVQMDCVGECNLVYFGIDFTRHDTIARKIHAFKLVLTFSITQLLKKAYVRHL